MSKIQIEIQEILQRVITVEADDLIEAIDKVTQMHAEGKIILDSEDLKEISYGEYEEKIKMKR